VGYAAAMWLGFGEALAAVAGALTGLLFVAVSIKSEVLAASRSLSSRAAQTLVLFMTSVLIALVLVAPQSRAALGSELLAVAAVSGAVLLILDRRAGHGSDQRVARYLERFSPNLITATLVGVAGLTLLLEAGGGLVLADPGRCGESSWRRGQRVAVPRQGDHLAVLTPACKAHTTCPAGSRWG
jgi:hypothetical protein